jgi:uncharacterized membrane protein (UPF0182 family)
MKNDFHILRSFFLEKNVEQIIFHDASIDPTHKYVSREKSMTDDKFSFCAFYQARLLTCLSVIFRLSYVTSWLKKYTIDFKNNQTMYKANEKSWCCIMLYDMRERK